MEESGYGSKNYECPTDLFTDPNKLPSSCKNENHKS